MNEPILHVTPDGLTAHVDPPDHASFSSLDQYDDCPARWAAQKLADRPAGWLDARIIGRFTHAMLEDTAGRNGRLPETAGQWRTVAETTMTTQPDLLPDRVDDGHGGVKTPVDWLTPIVDRVSGFHLPIRLDPAAAEQRVDTHVWNIPMLGYVDYRDESGLILDWKTGKIPSDPSRHGDQLRVYTAMLTSIGIPVTGAADVYVHHADKPGYVAYTDLSDKAMDATAGRMRHAWDGMRTSLDHDRWEYRPSRLCGWCPLSRVCPVAQIHAWSRKASLTNGLDPADHRLLVDEPDSGFIPLNQPHRKENPHMTTSTSDVEDPWGLDTTPPAGRPTPMVGEGKPYEPTITGSHINLAGYGMGALADTWLLAARLADRTGQADHTRRLYEALLRIQTRIAHDTWPTVVPDVAPEDAAGLLHVLDMSITRDTRRILTGLLDHDPTLDDPTAVRLDDVMAALARARDRTGQALAASRDSLLHGLPRL